MRYFLNSKNVTYKEKCEPEHIYIFSGKCLATGKDVEVTIKSEDLYKYNRGAFIQKAFPYLSSSEREWLMTGIYNLPKDPYEDE